MPANPAVATLLAAVALLLLLLTAGTLLKNAELGGVLEQSDAARREANDALKKSDADRRKASDALWVSYRDQARAVRFSGRQGQRFEGLRAIRKRCNCPFRPATRGTNSAPRPSPVCRCPMSRCSACGRAGQTAMI